jgi:hypothetical protein
MNFHRCQSCENLIPTIEIPKSIQPDDTTTSYVLIDDFSSLIEDGHHECSFIQHHITAWNKLKNEPNSIDTATEDTSKSLCIELFWFQRQSLSEEFLKTSKMSTRSPAEILKLGFNCRTFHRGQILEKFNIYKTKGNEIWNT